MSTCVPNCHTARSFGDGLIALGGFTSALLTSNGTLWTGTFDALSISIDEGVDSGTGSLATLAFPGQQPGTLGQTPEPSSVFLFGAVLFWADGSQCTRRQKAKGF